MGSQRIYKSKRMKRERGREGIITLYGTMARVRTSLPAERGRGLEKKTDMWGGGKQVLHHH